MSWVAVILLAVVAALVTAVFLIVPAFKDTSFERMGVHLEAWFFFAILIMTNCKTPQESAVKTFVFFLVSQPLIYLVQVPFSSMGWGLFGYYRYWFLITLLTLPAAYIGWYIAKRNWLSVVILAPVLAFLGMTAWQTGTFCVRHFPHLLVAVLFCIVQIVVYVAAFLPDARQRLVGIAIPIATAVAIALVTPRLDVNSSMFLPNDPVLTDEAVVVVTDDDPLATVTIESTGRDSMVHVHAQTYGTMDFDIQDGTARYLYSVEIYEDDAGINQIRIVER